MPINATITTFNVFTAATKARAEYVNTNFNLFRGHLVPIDPNTATATDNTYDLGHSTHQWKDIYVGTDLIKAGVTTTQLPVGGIVTGTWDSAPAGLLLMDGSSLDRAVYSRLFAAWGNVPRCGYNTNTHFYIPDGRGVFLRGQNRASGNDPNAATRTYQLTSTALGDTVCSWQNDATAVNGLSVAAAGAHNHYLHTWQYSGSSSNIQLAGSTDPGTTTSQIDAVGNHVHGLAGDLETRPINLAVNFFIKY